MAYKFYMGQGVIDEITSTEGFITGRGEFITGPNRYLVTPKAPADEIWFDEDRLTITGDMVVHTR